MKRWNEVLVATQTSLRDAAQILDVNTSQVIIVVGEENRLLSAVKIKHFLSKAFYNLPAQGLAE